MTSTREHRPADVAANGGRIAWSDASGQLIVREPESGAHAVAIHGGDAILVGGAGGPAGCFSWSRA